MISMQTVCKGGGEGESGQDTDKGASLSVWGDPYRHLHLYPHLHLSLRLHFSNFDQHLSHSFR